MDEVYTAGMFGKLCNNDGRSKEEPKKNYGAGGVLTNSKYMLSLTFNAPKESFNDEGEYLFQGKSVDDLFFPQHMNFRFFGMKPLPTFVCYDVMKNADIEDDFKRLEKTFKRGILMSSIKLSAGDKFPEIVVKKLGGGEFKLGIPQNGATWQMIVIYRGKHCPLCTKYLAKIHGMKEEFLKAGVDIGYLSRYRRESDTSG